MKIKKYKTQKYRDGWKLYAELHKTKKEALENVEFDNEKKYEGEVEIDIFCESCEKDINLGDGYIKFGNTRYCSDCYEEESFTYYTVGGEHVGDENDVEEYDGPEEEGECEAE